jgi:hypothetical protein
LIVIPTSPKHSKARLSLVLVRFLSASGSLNLETNWWIPSGVLKDSESSEEVMKKIDTAILNRQSIFRAPANLIVNVEVLREN